MRGHLCSGVGSVDPGVKLRGSRWPRLPSEGFGWRCAETKGFASQADQRHETLPARLLQIRRTPQGKEGARSVAHRKRKANGCKTISLVSDFSTKLHSPSGCGSHSASACVDPPRFPSPSRMLQGSQYSDRHTSSRCLAADT